MDGSGFGIGMVPSFGRRLCVGVDRGSQQTSLKNIGFCITRAVQTFLAKREGCPNSASPTPSLVQTLVTGYSRNL